MTAGWDSMANHQVINGSLGNIKELFSTTHHNH